MMLWHPHLQSVSCSDCRRWVYDFKEKKFAKRGEKLQERTPKQPPPCHLCPRKHWSHEHRTRLSKRNLATWQMYLRAKTNGLTDAEREDPIVQRSLSICREIEDQYNAFERSRELQALFGAGSPAPTGRTPHR